jgi:hypothetical protein
MECGGFKDRLSGRVGYLFLEANEREHLEQCPECRSLYEEYLKLENDLNNLAIKPLSAVEFAMVQQKLDKKINRFQRKAISFYGLFTRYGAGFVAAAFLFFVSLWSGFEYGVYYTENETAYDSYYLADNGYSESDEVETMDDEYIGLLLNDYTQNYGFNSSDLLLGDLTQDELEYLENNLNAGDIL